MAADHETSYSADGPSPYGFRTAGPNIDLGGYFVGKQVGVHAIGGSDYGMKGESRNRSGVRGDGEWGVFGLGKQSGVMGVNYGLKGAGVHGVHTRGQGISGDSPYNHPPYDEPGAGVYGWSDEGYGGVFSSDRRAQISLVPKFNYLPSEGQAGDLIVIGGYDPPTGTGKPPELWLCVTAGDSANPAYWSKVQVSDPVRA